jgi:hypothetical protein
LNNFLQYTWNLLAYKFVFYLHDNVIYWDQLIIFSDIGKCGHLILVLTHLQ